MNHTSYNQYNQGEYIMALLAWQIALIVIGSLLGLLLLGVIGFFVFLRGTADSVK
jgi:hypothetical protein